MHGQTFCLIFAAITSQVKKKKKQFHLFQRQGWFFGFFFSKIQVFKTYRCIIALKKNGQENAAFLDQGKITTATEHWIGLAVGALKINNSIKIIVCSGEKINKTKIRLTDEIFIQLKILINCE